jgi:hypothetical protein
MRFTSTNRDAIVTYARKHWNTPCDDGIIVSRRFKSMNVASVKRSMNLPDADKWRAVFIPDLRGEQAAFIRSDPNGKEIDAPSKPAELAGRFEIRNFHNWDGLVDCAHYISRCLKQATLQISEVDVSSLIRRLRGMEVVKTLGNEVTKDQGDRILDSGIMRPGDVIGYLHEDFKNRRTYEHSAIYLGLKTDPKNGSFHDITCHTKSRLNSFYYNDKWFLGGSGFSRYTFLHFADDSDQPQPLVSNALTGWWEITWRSFKYYYFFRKDGTVGYTTRAPRNVKQPLFAAEGSGYWFTQGFGVIVFWPRSGSVEKYGLARPVPWNNLDSLLKLLGGIPGVLNDNEPLMAKKL